MNKTTFIFDKAFKDEHRLCENDIGGTKEKQTMSTAVYTIHLSTCCIARQLFFGVEDWSKFR